MLNKEVIVIGAGLAGCEAAWQIANSGVEVKLVEMRPIHSTPAHHTSEFGELVCSNSFGALSTDRAAGLLQEELRTFNSLIINTADEFSVPAGGALAVDRSKFSKSLTQTLSNHPLVEIKRFEQLDLPDKNRITVIATGPLTSNELANKLKNFTGLDSCHFFDAASPIIYGETINYDIAFRASRYDKGDPAYLNCPMNKIDYLNFRNALIEAEQATLKDFEKESANFFEACLPIEEMARRGVDTMRYGPLKSIGLWNPKWGDLFDRENRLKKRPHAIVQLRKEDLKGKLLNMVGFQTNLKWSEQKRIFRMIPGLEKAEFVRFGVMHRNTFLESPKLLLPTLQFLKRENLFAAGQITGTEGYAAAASGGLLAGLNASLLANNKSPVTFPDESMIGALMNFISNKNEIMSQQKKNKFQPMPASFGLVPELNNKIKDKKLRYKAYQKRSLEVLKEFKKVLDSSFEKDHILV
ncbi:NAD binding site:Glucose inhibited division protein A family [Prochlorococcus marinus str. MIT 9515]|uniref:Methylenetetrahydrofolate--tRNA-(uracil-5-)-methyltransferase TrmFO n=1 Tax=Prochlorococcus marinus (strain MIT 9515) TaxID=167542 RepID=TRMFO_PROM5|nr:methylenetetrahydrofolate--tRNA-(uracil(54)-C(5))-methyltransferase (FADH(2)-oxidizing) TrmFO [Prochlorococcus marinus]A2BXA3.1 RecName: Full=Methylenetetrahydrofolate--tRNA-(uracil-5-)-methyltransferase TrmFO; AltName: Full=Folate-dependent tRNA (uracil-5-)-methyltransferase; AltName: Full=Folate-dependent tRNA(M-5-U54)-methyltransferase [Prochlorococcus marinus str. MIT 9515]ABM72414.1 NAD binding site:Glucose inhibited division protein A family [Prochlorococcus marinus str. MIT 9515]